MTTLSATIYTYKSQWGRYFCKLDYLWVSILGVMKIECGGGQSLSQAIYLPCLYGTASLHVCGCVSVRCACKYVCRCTAINVDIYTQVVFIPFIFICFMLHTHTHACTYTCACTHTHTHHTHTHTAITIQFTSSVFAADYDPTIGE